MATILNGSDPRSIETAAAALQAGELVAFPTETVYGLGADALNARAVAQVFAVKNRPYFDPLIVHLPNQASARAYAVEIDYRATMLMERFWPGPLTLVLRKKPIVPDIVTAGLDSVALRVPAHPVALALLRAVGKPIAAPSANPFGYVSPTTAMHVQELLGDKIKLILDGGPCRVGVESTVCMLTEQEAVILRPGGVTVEEIEAVIGPVTVATDYVDARSPGTLPRHYSPHVQLQLLAPGELLPQPRSGERLGALTVSKRQDVVGYENIEALSSDGNLIEVAANLFAALRRIDNLGLDRVVIESVPEHGLGRAIMDRLRRAATR
jgi:L-threonylcarbamoyladenylate synthase